MTIVEPILTFFFYAIVAIAAQNAIFTRALGVSRLVKIVDDGSVELFKFGALLTAVQLISSLLSFFAGRALPYKAAFLPLVLVLCSAIAFFIVLLVLVLPKKRALAKDYLSLLPMATFNCSILGTLLLTSTGGYTLLQSMGFSLGSALGYVLAVVLVNEGQRKIQNRGVPATFRGLPITLLYIGVLALAIYGFSGHTPAI
ncbi:MAG: Rnf-Nqr domain containing protein [Pygmaiobacter sp.]|nr:Rnf-Nqr domain containing protein [Pygmaiobacter sp.]